jgi:CBS domain-containing protein
MAMGAVSQRLVDGAKRDADGDVRRTRVDSVKAPRRKASARLTPESSLDAKSQASLPASGVTPVSTPRAAPASRARPKAGKRASTAADLMRSPAVCCHLEETLQRAAQLMWEHDVGAVVVVDDGGRPRHVVTDRDLCMGAFTQGVALWQSPLRSVRPAPAVCCSVDSGVNEVCRLMKEHGIRRLAVVDASGAAVGMIGLGDLIREATLSTPKSRTRGLTPVQLARTLSALYEDTGVPEGRSSPLS